VKPDKAQNNVYLKIRQLELLLNSAVDENQEFSPASID